MIRLTLKLEPGRDPILFARCSVPTIVGARLDWFCRSVNEPKVIIGGVEQYRDSGWKVVIVSRSRNELIRKKGLESEHYAVQVLRVVKDARVDDTCILAEIAEW